MATRANQVDLVISERAPDADARAAASVWARSSTLDVPVDVRFEYHRNLSLAMGARVEPVRGASTNFFAQSKYAMAPDGTSVTDFAVDPCITHFGSGHDDSTVEIGMLCAGTMHVRHGSAQTTVVSAGHGLVLFDAARPSYTHTTRCAAIHLQIPRAAVVTALGGDAVPPGAALRPLATNVLTAQLARCLWTLRGECAYDADQVHAALHAARALALVALANTRGAGHRWPDELEQALYRVACHQLAQHVGNPRVTVEAVAAVLQCSRAQLYRLFVARGQSVAGYLRELRMQRAVEWLSAYPGTAIGTIADACGYGELISFDRAFRRRFGTTPRAWRAEHGTSPAA